MQYFGLLSLLPVALAQYGSSGGSKTTVGAAAQQTPAAAVDGVHIVRVGESGLTFSPNSITAPVGDTVEFHFYPQAHSVAQSSFAAPCAPLNSSAIFSGPVPVSSGEGKDVFSIKIQNTAPIWYYCATGRHCQSGMGGVINPPANRTIEQYIQAAGRATSNVAPSTVQGGTLGAAAVAPGSTDKPGAGAETYGRIQWGLLSLAMAAAGTFGGLLV